MSSAVRILHKLVAISSVSSMSNQPLIEATQTLAQGEAEVHDGANHGFAVPGPGYHDAAADRSYDRTRTLLDALR